MQQNENPAGAGTPGGAGNLDLAISRSRPEYNQPRRRNLGGSPHIAAAGDSRRLVGTRWSAAVPDTAMAAALLTALKRKSAGVP